MLRGRINRPDDDDPKVNRGLRFEACARVSTEGGTLTAEGDSLRVTEANAVTIVIGGATGLPG